MLNLVFFVSINLREKGIFRGALKALFAA